MKNPNELMIKEIEKFEGRTKDTLNKAITAAALTGVCASLTAVFAYSGLDSVAKDAFIGKSLGYGALTLLFASFGTYSYGKAYSYFRSLNNKIEIYSDMAEDQFVQKLEK